MTIVIIVRGIDLSMIAKLAVPAGLILKMVQNRHSVFGAFAAAASLACLACLLGMPVVSVVYFLLYLISEP
jgi:ribose transport system permease protein